MNLSKFEFIGHLGADPEMIQVGEALKASISLGVNRVWTDAEGSRREETDWFTVEAWRSLAETFRGHLKKGRLVYLAGTVRKDSWQTEEGEPRSRERFVVRDFRFLDRKPGDPEQVEEG